MAGPDGPHRASEYRSAAVADAARAIGVGQLTPDRVKDRYTSLRRQTQIGVKREGPSTTADGGLLAVKTGIPDIATVWPSVPANRESVTYVGDYGGKNWKAFRAEKREDGSIILEHSNTTVYPEDNRKEVTWDGFIGRMAYPIAAEYLRRDGGYPDPDGQIAAPDDQVNIGVSFGFPHRNVRHEGGIDSVLIDVGEDGSLPKLWRITDWAEQEPEARGNVTAALREKLIDLGVNVGAMGLKAPAVESELQPGIAVSINDTNSVSKDEGAAESARAEGFVVLDASIVGGNGTNTSANGTNHESGHGKHIGEPEDEIHKRMRQKGLVKGDSEAEHETGVAITFRVATALELLEEKGVLDGGRAFGERILRESEKQGNQGMISNIASGELETNEIIQDVARRELTRAGQNYGILIANAVEEALGEEGADPTKKYAFRVEGSTLLKGYGVKAQALETAEELLGFPVHLIEAEGVKGVAALAMAYSHLPKDQRAA